MLRDEQNTTLVQRMKKNNFRFRASVHNRGLEEIPFVKHSL